MQVMMTCILGMVEKTQRAITILQQRQTATVNIRTTEEIVAAVQDKANAAIMEVKKAALEEIKKATGDSFDEEKEVKSGYSNNLWTMNIPPGLPKLWPRSYQDLFWL